MMHIGNFKKIDFNTIFIAKPNFIFAFAFIYTGKFSLLLHGDFSMYVLYIMQKGSANCFVGPCYKQFSAAGQFPDFSILTADGQRHGHELRQRS
jgi:hypothetical protein